MFEVLGAEVGESMAQAMLDEFMGICGVPHPSGHCEAIRAYLLNWAAGHGFDGQTDGGNVWFNVPATPGREALPLVIVQGHMDMVPCVDDGLDFDFANDVITVRRDGDLLTAEGTTLGADDGAGLALALALAGGAAPHGPLRVFATYDEETTMAGAVEVLPQVLDASYLLNADEDLLGNVVVSSAGLLASEFVGSFQTGPAAIGEAVVLCRIWGLPGGHSGAEIHKGHVNANDAMVDAISALVDAGMEPRLVSFQGGTAVNVIPVAADVVLSVRSDVVDQAMALMEKTLQSVFDAAGETGSIQVALEPTSAHESVSTEDTRQILAFAKALPRRVICMSEVVPGLVRTSHNLGVIDMKAGALVVRTSIRSCEDDDMEQLKAQFEALAEESGFTYQMTNFIPAWPARAQNPLADAVAEAYRQVGVEPHVLAVHGGLEPSWFSRKNPALFMVSVGPSFWAIHSTGETMDLSTFPAFGRAMATALINLPAK